MTNINICSLYTLSKSKESAKYLWFLLQCKLSNCTELQFHIHALMILRKIRRLLSNNPFVHFPVWHFDSSYDINFVSLEDQTMQIIITTISCVPLTRIFHLFYALLLSWFLNIQIMFKVWFFLWHFKINKQKKNKTEKASSL